MSMTPATPTQLKTKAEAAYAEQFESALAGLPGAADARRAAFGRFTAQGLPHRRLEEWKYTDLRAAVKEALPPAPAAKAVVAANEVTAALGPLAVIDGPRLVFIDGHFSAEHSVASAIAGLSIATLANAAGASAPAGDVPATVALNHAFASDGAVVEVMAGAKPTGSLVIVFLSTAVRPATITTRNIIIVGADAAASVVEIHAQIGTASTHTNTSTKLQIGDRAVVDHAKVIIGASGAIHLANWDVSIGIDALYRPAQLTPSCGLARHDVNVTLNGRNGKLDFSGIALGRGSDHIDTTMVIHHVAPGCESRELFKTILDGNARAVFQGKVIVDKDAQKTDGKQMAKALMLSPNAEFDSKPELEIYADDVACGHGSTCAEIDPDLIFYCRSRGIPEAQARALLLESFVGDAIDMIDRPDIRRAFTEIAQAWLTHKSA